MMNQNLENDQTFSDNHFNLEAKDKAHETLMNEVKNQQIVKSNVLISEEIDESIRDKIKEYLDKHLLNKLDIGVLGPSCIHKHDLMNNLSYQCDEENDSNEIIDEEIFDYCFVSPVKPISYPHKYNSNITVWDIPENLNRSINDYIKFLNINKYDLFLLCKNSYFDQTDIEVIKAIKSLNKKCFLIRLNIQNVIKDGKTCCQSLINSYLSEEDQNKLVEQIKTEIKADLIKEKCHDHDNIYLISPNPKDRKTLDFIKLNIDMIENLDKDKMESLALSVKPFSKEIIDKKFKILKSRIFYAAIVSTMCGILLFPHIALIADMTFIAREIWYYQKQFGINKETLKKLSKSSKVLYDKFLTIVSKNKYASLIVLNDICSLTGLLIKTLPLFTLSNTFDLIKYVPILGSIVHGSISFATTKYTLMNILEEFLQVAYDVNKLLLDFNKTQTLDEAKDADTNFPNVTSGTENQASK